jgi:hypothetical protein
MPRSVRFGVWLMGIALLWRLATLFSSVWAGPTTATSVGRSVFTLCVYGGLLYAIARRRNWARLTVGALFVIALPFAVIELLRYAGLHQVNVVSRPIATFVLIGILQGAGVVCLFLPASTRWYHRLGDAASQAGGGSV